MGRTRSAGTVSVLIPTYNRAWSIGEALGSACAQTYSDLEILVVDNASTDDTLSHAREAAAGDPRVQLIEGDENLGMEGNFERCLSLATGDYVKFLMSDDVLLPEAVERLVQPLAEHSDIALSTSRRYAIDQDGRRGAPLWVPEPLDKKDGVLDGIEVGNALLQLGNNFLGEPTTTLFRRGAIEPRGAFQLTGTPGRTYRICGDVTLWLKLLAHGKLAFFSEPLSCLRMHAGRGMDGVQSELEAQREWVWLVEDARRIGFLHAASTHRTALWNAVQRLSSFALTKGSTALDLEVCAAVREAMRQVADLSAGCGGRDRGDATSRVDRDRTESNG